MTRILVLSDIHGNLYALKAILEHARKWDEILVLGDLVDYGPHPSEVIDVLLEHGARVLRGNHDHAVAYGVDCRCGDEIHWLSVWFRENITLKLIDENLKGILGKLPTTVTLDIESFRITATHAAPRNPLYAYLYPWASDEETCELLRKPLRLREDSEACPQGVFLVGHTHYQFYRVVHGAIVANPGSVGQPRDGDPRAGYLILDTAKGSIELYRVRYDIGRFISALRSLGIPEPYFSALKHMALNAELPTKLTDFYGQ